MLDIKAIYNFSYLFSIFLLILESLANAMSINKIYFVISFSGSRSLIILK